MATIQEYKDVAPIIGELGFTKAQIENAMAKIEDKPAPNPDPEITKAKVAELYNKVVKGYAISESVANAGGYASIAREVGLTKQQVKELISEIQAMYNVYKGPVDENTEI